MAATGGRPDGAGRRRLSLRLRGGSWLTGPIALFTVLRIPSFLEPHWYTDEAGYVTTARALLQGKVLYTQIWNNKPPIHLWTVAVVIQLFGTGEAALHAITFATGLLTLLAVAYLGRHLLSPRRTLVALLVVAVLLGSPLFDAELLVPESLLIVPITWAGAILLTRAGRPDRRRWPLWPVAVGVLAGIAVGYQQTALAETCAFGLILALVGRATWRRVVVYATTVLAVTAAWLIPAIVTAGARKVAYALVGYWIPFTQYRYSGGGAGHLLLHLILPVGVLALLLAGAWLCRRDREPRWGLWIWAGAALLVPAVARQPWAHYLIPSLVPTVLALSSLPLRSPEGATLARRLAGGALVVGTLVAAAGASSAGMDWVDIIDGNPHNVFVYYGGAASVLTRGQSLDAYQDQFDYRVPEDSAVSAWISAHGLDGSSAVVWSADAWLYDDNQLQLILPTPPIYNDEALFGNYGPLGHKVAELDPEVVVTEGSSRQSYPEINSVLTTGYREVDQSGTEIVWVRDGLVAAVTASPAGG